MVIGTLGGSPGCDAVRHRETLASGANAPQFGGLAAVPHGFDPERMRLGRTEGTIGGPLQPAGGSAAIGPGFSTSDLVLIGLVRGCAAGPGQ